MNKKALIFLFVLCLILFSIFHLNNGLISLQLKDFFHSIFSYSTTNQNDVIFREIRIPRTLIAIIAGSSLSISGLLLQTFFNNPLAGPSVLGITSGSSLFVAISVMTSFAFFQSNLGIIVSSFLGAIIFSLIILFFSIFVKNRVSLLLIGMMLGSFSSAIIQMLEISSTSNDLKIFTLWGFGSLQNVNYNQIPIIISVFLISLFLLFFIIKPLNILVLGESQAKVLGLNLKQFRLVIVFVSSLFAGLITAFCGPISFIGLAVPNIAKQVFKTQNHFKLILYSALIGAFILLFCDLIIMRLENYFLIPLNAITALIGAPFVIWIILKKY